MNRLTVLGCCLVATLALAEDRKPLGSMPATSTATTTANTAKTAPPATNDMAAAPTGWVPRKVTKEDKKGLDAFCTANHEAWKKGDIEAAASMVDFPVTLVTDDANGVVTSTQWTRDQWIANMNETMKAMPKDMPEPKMKHTYFFITDTIASIQTVSTMKMGGKSMTLNSQSLVVNRDGKWLTKTMVEGGWGGTMKTPPAQQGMK